MNRHLLVIGAQRCGTTYLHSLLDAHPEITMARPARPEPKFFCDVVASAKGLQWYLDTYFEHADDGQLLGDKSTSYLEDPEAAVRARDMLGEAQVVVMLRDPIGRAVSNWRFSTENGFEERPLETALRENLARPEAWDPTVTSVSPFAYLERGRYLDHLEPWFTAFPDKVHVVFLSEVLGDGSTLERLWETLGVDPGVGPPPREEAVNRSEVEAPALSGALRGTLETYFEASDRALGARLGRPLPWGRTHGEGGTTRDRG